MTQLTNCIKVAAIGAALLATAAPTAHAQGRMTATVVYIAGTDLYLNVGSESGLAAADTIFVFEPGAGSPLGMLVVQSVSSSRAVVTFAADIFPVTRGTRLEISDARAPEPVPVASAVGPSRRSPGRARTPPELTGRVSFDITSIRSQRDGLQVGSTAITETYTTPTARLRFRVSRLPAGLEFNLNTRVSRRYATNLDQTVQSSRIYQASVGTESRNSVVQVQLGRFYNRYDVYSGFWDGAMARLGTRRIGVGFVAGFEPQLSNEGFSTDRPRYSAFGNIEVGKSDLRYSNTVSVTRQLTGPPGSRNTTFVAVTQSVRLSRLRLNHDMQYDRDGVRGAWILSRLNLSGQFDLGGGLRAFSRFSLRQPFVETDTVAGTFRRDVLTGGLTHSRGGHYVTVSATVTLPRNGPRGYAYSGSFNLRRVPLVKLGLNASAVYRKADAVSTILFSPGLHRRLGRTTIRAAYRYYRTDSPFVTLTTRGGELSASLPMGRNLTSTLRVRSQFGNGLSSTDVYAGFWASF